MVVKKINNLTIYYPNYTHIELVCGKMPDINDTSIVFCASASYTGRKLKKFSHNNIAGNHISNGIFYTGYSCIRTTGAFIYDNNQYIFKYLDYDLRLVSNGMAFTQEMLIYNGFIVPYFRSNYDFNKYRALCELNGELCIIDSNRMFFKTFIQNLLSLGVTHALYLDMGFGWNYSWYRDDSLIIINKFSSIYSTNWLVIRDER